MSEGEREKGKQRVKKKFKKCIKTIMLHQCWKNEETKINTYCSACITSQCVIRIDDLISIIK